jgi:hypothetical protein
MRAQRTFRARLYGASILPGLRLLRLLAMNRQNASISATWSSERRTASASDRTPGALLGRCRARGSTKNAFRVSARDPRIVVPRRNSSIARRKRRRRRSSRACARRRCGAPFDSGAPSRKVSQRSSSGAERSSMVRRARLHTRRSRDLSRQAGGGSCWNLKIRRLYSIFQA